ncbi:MAG TPA: hypothetical protein ENI87_09275 [bacterium]|nr:hypothetical protein [bacterium]
MSLSLCVLSSLSAQAGNEVLFVGSSTSGSTDQHAFVESATGNVLVAAGSPFTDNCTDAVWAHSGRRLYLGQSLMNQVAQADWNGSSPSWSTLYSAPGACYGVELDVGRNRLWTLTGASASTRELVCIDVDINSPNYGSVLAQTAVLGTQARERWGLSYPGNLACVPAVFLNSGGMDLVDTNPASATFLQVVASSPVPGANSGFTFASDCAVSLDELYAYVLFTGLGQDGLAVYDIGSGTWLDFDPAPGTQSLVFSDPIPNLMALSLDRSFAIVSGQGGAGWVARVDFDYANPSNSTITPYQLSVPVPDCNAVSLSPEQTRAAVTSTATFLSTPSELTVFDVNTGALLQNVTLSAMWNVYTTAWQDASPIAHYSTFGSGCSGSIGTPVLLPAAGSRPALGSAFDVEVSNLPFGVAAMATGLSASVTSGGLPLPFDLTVLGMPGCTQYVDALVLDVIQSAGTTATWTWNVPSSPSLFGQEFFNQAFSLDPAANAFGFVASNAGNGKLGY